MSQVNINASAKLSGRFKLVVKDKEGNTTKETGWMDNLITNAGLDNIGGSGYPLLSNFTVGTSNTLPTFTDTQLNGPLTPVASTAAGYGSYITYTAGTPPYWSSIFTGTFAIGVATGILAEIGVTGANGLLFSHALIVDSVGNPTTITVLATESLQVSYELRLNWDITTYSGTILINGITYNLTWLPSNISNVSADNFIGIQFNNVTTFTVYNGSIQTILLQPTGSSASVSDAGTFSTYTNGNYYIDYTIPLSVSQGNVTGGITAMYLQTFWHRYQIGITPAIPKDSTHSMTFSCRFGWGRV